MTNQDYERKKRECFVQFCKDNGIDQEVNISIFDTFDQIFDRSYALGKEKETITQEEIEKAAKEYAAEVDKNVRDLYGIENPPASLTFGECAAESFREGVKFALGKHENDADTVIQGWVARDDDGELYIYSKKPNRTQWLRWAEGSNFLPLLPDLFPDLTWEDDPQEVEIIIKRKKNG